MTLRPLITICGTTGVGKSKLAIEIALHVAQTARRHGWKGARIINADSMQVYSGMDIITNKVPEADRQGVEHLLMGIREPWEQYVVGEWVHDAMQIVDETHRRNQIPIVVGGTSYWIQHLLFPDRLVSPLGDSTRTLPAVRSPALSRSIASLPPELLDLFNGLSDDPPASSDAKAALALYHLLAAIDPPIAARWHWRDIRKVLRSLLIIKEQGRLNSEVIDDQSSVPLTPRYRTLCFWLYAAPTSLYPRLDARVEEMIERGLLDEIRALRDLPMSTLSRRQDDGDGKVDYTLGLYQSIGYKEFHVYLNASEPSQKDFDEAVENMKMATRRYAKRQVSWIQNKLLPAVHAINSHTKDRPVAPTYLLDATELDDKWVDNVQLIAESLTQGFLLEQSLPDPLGVSETACTMLSIKEKPTSPVANLNARRKVICRVCTVNQDEPVMIDETEQWEIHQQTRSHRRRASKLSRAIGEYGPAAHESRTDDTDPEHTSSFA